jgi:hypothetical protein
MSHKQAKHERASALEIKFTPEELQMLLTWSNVIGYQIPPGTKEETLANMARVQNAFQIHDAIVAKLTHALQSQSNSSSTPAVESAQKT